MDSSSLTQQSIATCQINDHALGRGTKKVCMKILRRFSENYKAQFPELNVFVCQKSCVIITFKMLKMAFSRKKDQQRSCYPIFSQFISVKVKRKWRNTSGSNSEKAKKIEALAKSWFS